jgi:hypothetical protein
MRSAGGEIPALVTAMQNKQRQRETAAATVDRLDGQEKAAASGLPLAKRLTPSSQRGACPGLPGMAATWRQAAVPREQARTATKC